MRSKAVRETNFLRTAARHYKPKMRRLLQAVRQVARQAGMADVTLVDEVTDEEYAYSVAWRNKAGKVVDVTIYLTEEKVREGTGSGLAFLLSITEASGRVLGTFAPANYAAGLWTRDAESLAHRWAYFSGMDIGSIVRAGDGREEGVG